MNERVIRRDMPESAATNEVLKKLALGKAIITAEEMKSLIDDWTLSGFGDLFIDESLLERLNRYTEYRKELASAVSNLLEQEFNRYVVDKDDVEYCDTINITSADNKVCLSAPVFILGDSECIVEVANAMHIRDFKRLVAYLGNRVVSYAYGEAEEVYIDFYLYLKERGIDVKVKTSKSDDVKSLQLIFPEDEERKNDKSVTGNVQ